MLGLSVLWRFPWRWFRFNIAVPLSNSNSFCSPISFLWSFLSLCIFSATLFPPLNSFFLVRWFFLYLVEACWPIGVSLFKIYFAVSYCFNEFLVSYLLSIVGKFCFAMVSGIVFGLCKFSHCPVTFQQNWSMIAVYLSNGIILFIYFERSPNLLSIDFHSFHTMAGFLTCQ